MKLNDMEESLYKIKNSISKNLMEDALRSYSVGILRGGVVFTYLATIEHIKENCISILDVSDSDVKKWINDVFSNSDKYVPESNIPDFLHCADRKLINEQQKNFLKDLIFKRNKCVHSDYEFTLTAEDVRYLYNNAIELFLKKNNIFGRAAIKQFLALVISSDNIFLNKNLDECEVIVNDNLKLNLDFIKSIPVFYDEIIKCYKENNKKVLRDNLEKIIYLSCKGNPDLFSYFMKSSILEIAKNDIGINIVIYNILLRVNPESFIEYACQSDKENFLRLFTDILSARLSLECENCNLVNILLKNGTSNLDIDVLELLIKFKLDINKSDSIFDFTYKILNYMEFKTIDTYMPKYLNIWDCMASRLFSDEECYKIYLRLLKNNILLFKENVMHMISNSEKYNSIRLKASSFLEKNNNIDFKEILFSSDSYSNPAKVFCDPNNSEINIWNEMIIDNDLLRLINDDDLLRLNKDKSINYPSLYPVLQLHKNKIKNAIITCLDNLKSSTSYEDKKSLVLKFLEKESEQ